jgi:hypothetical protein
MDELIRQRLESRIARVEQQIRSFKELYAGELQIVLDELTSIREELASLAPKATNAPLEGASESQARPTDPAANSPRRAAWLAEEKRKEEQRNAPLSRRELLRGRDREEGS